MGPVQGFKVVPCTKSRLFEGPSTFLAPKWLSLLLVPFKGANPTLMLLLINHFSDAILNFSCMYIQGVYILCTLFKIYNFTELCLVNWSLLINFLINYILNVKGCSQIDITFIFFVYWRIYWPPWSKSSKMVISKLWTMKMKILKIVKTNLTNLKSL